MKALKHLLVFTTSLKIKIPCTTNKRLTAYSLIYVFVINLKPKPSITNYIRKTPPIETICNTAEVNRNNVFKSLSQYFYTSLIQGFIIITVKLTKTIRLAALRFKIINVKFQ